MGTLKTKVYAFTGSGVTAEVAVEDAENECNAWLAAQATRPDHPIDSFRCSTALAVADGRDGIPVYTFVITVFDVRSD